MPTIRWTGPGVFTDRQREFEARPGSEHDVGEEQAEAYLEHEQFSHRFERVDDANEGDEETDDGDADADEAETVDDDVADDLLEEHWQHIKNQILSGSVDDDLGDLREAEQRRDSPRPSVMSALDEREAELDE